MKYFYTLIILLLSINLVYLQGDPCAGVNCNSGTCNNGNCTCKTGYVNYKNQYCNYQQKEKLVAFLLSFLIGATGADWFYLAVGNGGYITAGVFKLLTGIFGIIAPCLCLCAGGLRSDKSKAAGFILIAVLVGVATITNSIWWIVDWIRILTDSFKDGNSIGLKNW